MSKAVPEVLKTGTKSIGALPGGLGGVTPRRVVDVITW